MGEVVMVGLCASIAVSCGLQLLLLEVGWGERRGGGDRGQGLKGGRGLHLAARGSS